MCSTPAAAPAPPLRRTDHHRFSFLRSTPPTYHPPQFVSFRIKSRPTVCAASSLNETVVDPSSMSFYDLLGIPVTGSSSDIKQAYKQLARKYHPDVSPPDRVDEYTRRFIRVQEAYETLSDPSRRELYDRDMANGVHLVFTARRRGKFDEQTVDKSEWKNRWQSQLAGLKRRSMQKETGEDMSWGARMRRERMKNQQ